MSNNLWFIIGIFSALAAFCIWAERKTKWGAKLGSIVIALIGGIILVNIGILPAKHSFSGIIYGYLVPISIPLLLFQANIRRVLKIGPKLLLAFFIAIIPSLLGGFVCALIFNVGPETYKVYSIFTASALGGVAQMAAIGNAFKITDTMWTVTSAVSTVFCSLWLILLFNCYRWGFLRKILKLKDNIAVGKDLDKVQEEIDERAKQKATVYEIALVFGAAIVIAALAVWLESITGIYALLFSSTMALILASVTKISDIPIAEEFGMFLLLFLMINMGAGAVLSGVITASPIIILGCLSMYVIHGFGILLLGRLWKSPLEYVMLASNATIGGPTTAAPMASLYGWKELVLPGILMGILGYVAGNYLSLLLGTILRGII